MIVSTLVIIGFLSYKLKNKEDSYSINLDDEEEQEEQLYDTDEEIYDTSFGEIEATETSIIPKEDIPAKNPPRTRSTTVRSEKNLDAVTAPRKRRIRATEEDSTVRVSKRRRLVDDQVKPKIRKRRAVRQSSDVEDIEMSDVLNRYEEN